MPLPSVRSHTVKKACRPQLLNPVTLKRVLGFTLTNNCAFSLDQTCGDVAYAAGCVVVVRSPASDRQTFIQSPNKKCITAVEFSADGKFIATGESGHQPMVRVWNSIDGVAVSELAGHHFRVVAIRFSPSTRHLVSIGCQEDNTIFVWDHPGGQRVASAKLTSKVNGVAFSPNGQFFVTVGVRHVKYWYLDTKQTRNKETIPLTGRNALLGDMLTNTFTDVACLARSRDEDRMIRSQETAFTDKNNNNWENSLCEAAGGEILTLTVTKAGHLMQFNEQRCLDKWVDLKTSRANCLSTNASWVVVGCAGGISLLFHAESLQFLAQLPAPKQLGNPVQDHMTVPGVGDPAGTSSDGLASCSSEGPTAAVVYPDVIALQLDRLRGHVICCYSDHSFYVWTVGDLSSIQCCAAHHYHSRGVWSVTDSPTGSPLSSCATAFDQVNLSRESFVTAGDDGTIRLWSIEETGGGGGGDGDSWKSGAHVKEHLSRVIYTDPSYRYLCASDCGSAGVGPVGGAPVNFTGGRQIDSGLPSPSSPVASTASAASAADFASCLSSGCVRTVCISPDGCHLAAGDRDGHLHIYAMDTLQEICDIRAHDSEILSLSFFQSSTVPELTLLCSASRDRLIHIFDPNQDYSLVQTVADHSGAIFAARIVETEEDGEIRLVSCGMDKSLLIRVLEPDDAGQTARFTLEHHLVGRHSQLDAALTPSIPTSPNSNSSRRRYLAVACQDRRLRIYNVATGRPVRCYRGSFNEDGCLVRCTIDPTGSIVVTSGSDKQVNLLHLLSGDSIATLFGHSELTLGLRLLPGLRHLITTSSDSCVFIWHLANQLRGGSLRRATSAAAPSRRSLRLPSGFSGLRDGDTTEADVDSEDEASTGLTSVGSVTDSEPVTLNETDGQADSELDEALERTLLSVRQRGPSTTAETSVNPTPMSRTAAPSGFYFSVSALPAWARRKVMGTAALNTDSAAAHPELVSSGGPTVPGVKVTGFIPPPTDLSAALPDLLNPIDPPSHASDRGFSFAEDVGTKYHQQVVSRSWDHNNATEHVSALDRLASASCQSCLKLGLVSTTTAEETQLENCEAKRASSTCSQISSTSTVTFSGQTADEGIFPSATGARTSTSMNRSLHIVSTFASRQRKSHSNRFNTISSFSPLKKAVSTLAVGKDSLDRPKSGLDRLLDGQSGNAACSPVCENTIQWREESKTGDSSARRPIERAVSQQQLTNPESGSRARWLFSDRLVSKTSTARSAKAANGERSSTNASQTRSSTRSSESSQRTARRPTELQLRKSMFVVKTSVSSPPASTTARRCSGRASSNGVYRDSTASARHRHILATSRQRQAGTPSAAAPAPQLEAPDTTQEALLAVCRALDLATRRCSQAAAATAESSRPPNAQSRDPTSSLAHLRRFFTDELEWRFTQLRALLGLPSVCLEPAAARVLLSDFVERLIPELQVQVARLSPPLLASSHVLLTPMTSDAQKESNGGAVLPSLDRRQDATQVSSSYEEEAQQQQQQQQETSSESISQSMTDAAEDLIDEEAETESRIDELDSIDSRRLIPCQLGSTEERLTETT